jgi:hypothetical protein
LLGPACLGEPDEVGGLKRACDCVDEEASARMRRPSVRVSEHYVSVRKARVCRAVRFGSSALRPRELCVPFSKAHPQEKEMLRSNKQPLFGPSLTFDVETGKTEPFR